MKEVTKEAPVNTYIENLKTALDNIIISKDNVILEYTEGIEELVRVFLKYKQDRKGVYFCGNGGSAGIAQHMTADFMKNGGLLAHSLYEQTVLTCLSNDFSYDSVFCKQLELIAKPGELLVAISSSGESENILMAIETIRQLRGQVITLTGFQPDNRVRSRGDINIYVPLAQYGIVESIHNLILQQIVDSIVAQDGIALRL